MKKRIESASWRTIRKNFQEEQEKEITLKKEQREVKGNVGQHEM